MIFITPPFLMTRVNITYPYVNISGSTTSLKTLIIENFNGIKTKLDRKGYSYKSLIAS